MYKCHVCHKECELIEHYFYTGTCVMSRTKNENPSKEWLYNAPLYHYNQDVGFCSPICSLEFFEKERNL